VENKDIDCCEKCRRSMLVLRLAKEKIEAYQNKFGMEYPGGQPINGLMVMINNELKENYDEQRNRERRKRIKTKRKS